LILCENASALTGRLVEQWLRDYMFGKLAKTKRMQRVNKLTTFLTDHKTNNTRMGGTSTETCFAGSVCR
jgi:hypothetical protein